MFALIAALAFAAAPALAAEEQPQPTEATFNISPVKAADLCLSVTDVKNGAGLKLAKCTDGNGVAYTYNTKNGSLKADARKASGESAGDYCIDVTNGDHHNGNLLQHWICVNPKSDNQQFDFEPVKGKEKENIYMIQPTLAKDYCFDVKDGNFSAGAEVQIWRCVDSNDNQQWTASNIADPDCDGTTDGSMETYTEELEKQQQKRGLQGHRRRTIF